MLGIASPGSPGPGGGLGASGAHFASPGSLLGRTTWTPAIPLWDHVLLFRCCFPGAELQESTSGAIYGLLCLLLSTAAYVYEAHCLRWRSWSIMTCAVFAKSPN